MKIKYYFEFPGVFNNKELDEYDFTNHRGDDLYQYVNLMIYQGLRKKYPDVEFQGINTVGTLGYHCPVCKFSFAFVVIENPDTKKYMVISYTDKIQGMSAGTNWDMENCVEIFTGVGVHDNDVDYRPHPDVIYTPATSVTTRISTYNKIEEYHKLKQPKIIPEKPYFRGGYYSYREWLGENDKRFHFEPDRIWGDKFIEEIGRYSINIDINGAAEVSCRTLDIMGLSSALIRPRLVIKYHNPLIPDYHFAQVKCDDLSDFPKLADAYIERFEDLKKDPDYVRFLSENGRKWYEENCTLESHLRIYMELIDLTKLE